MKVLRAGHDDFYLFPWLHYEPTWNDTEYQNNIRVWKNGSVIHSELNLSTLIGFEDLQKITIDLLDTLNKLRYYFNDNVSEYLWIETTDILSGKWKLE